MRTTVPKPFRALVVCSSMNYADGSNCTLNARLLSALSPLHRCEDLPVKEFIPEFPAEALNITVLPRVGRLDKNANFKDQWIF